MRRIISLILCVSLIFTLAACGGEPQKQNENENNEASKGPTESVENYQYKDTFVTQKTVRNPVVMGLFYRNVTNAKIESDDPAVLEVTKKADERLEKIENYPDDVKVEGTTYYLSNEGDDKNDGLTPETAKSTYSSFRLDLKPGDAVLFRRGDIFRGQIKLMPGVTYAAYGEGVKPRIYGSRDGKAYKWVEIEEDVYEYTGITGDYSNIIFNNGEFIGRPVQSMNRIKGRPLNVYLGKRLTIYSPDGNPGEIYHNIEIVDGYSLMTGGGKTLKDVKIQNLCLMYTGVHFLGTLGPVYGMEIEGCIMGYCGGRDLHLGTSVSLGNAVEFWSVAVDINIHDNYFFQAYDAALTHQGPTKTDPDSEQISATNYTNIHYEDNLLEFNTYDFEAFSLRDVNEQKNSPNGTFTYNDVYIRNNITRYTGWGWGSLDRPDKNVYATFKYDASGGQNEKGEFTNIHVKPLYIENNIFDRSRGRVLGISSPENNKNNMILKNNQFLQHERARIFGGATLDGNYLEAINSYFTASGNTFKLVDY